MEASSATTTPQHGSTGLQATTPDTSFSVPLQRVSDSPTREIQLRKSEPCVASNADSQKRTVACRSSTSHESLSPGKYSEVVWISVNKADMGHLADSRSADELQVLLTMIDNLASGSRALHLSVQGRDKTCDDMVRDWNEVLTFEHARLEVCCFSEDDPKHQTDGATSVSEHSPDEAESCTEACCWLTETSYEICRTHRFQMLQCQSEGVEIRCFSKPLEEWTATNSTIRFLSRYWTRNSSGIYKIKWIDLLTDSRISPVLVDVDLLESSLMETANDLHCHVSPICPRAKIWLRFFRSKSSHKYIKTLVREACRALEVNNRVQVNRLNAGYVAFNIGLRDGSTRLRDFTEDYFTWPSELEAHESDNTLWSLPRFEPFHIDARWLQEPFEKKASSVVMAELRFDIEKLVSLLTRDGTFVLANESSSLGQCALTSISLARILIGAGSVRHDYKTAATLGSYWGAYSQYKFSDLRDVCHKVLLKLVA